MKFHLMAEKKIPLPSWTPFSLINMQEFYKLQLKKENHALVLNSIVGIHMIQTQKFQCETELFMALQIG